MIFLKSANILFLKPKKVAGTSFEIALSKFAEAEDIIGPLIPKDEAQRRDLGFRTAQNHKIPVRVQARGWLQQLAARIAVRKSKMRPHISAADTRDLLGADVFEAACKVSIVRNPYDRLVSQYHWKTRRLDTPPAFCDWLRQNPNVINTTNLQYMIGDRIIVDEFLRYEHLIDDILALEAKLPRIAGTAQLMTTISAKSGIRPKSKSTMAYFAGDDEMIDLVARKNHDIIKRFGYRLA